MLPSTSTVVAALNVGTLEHTSPEEKYQSDNGIWYDSGHLM